MSDIERICPCCKKVLIVRKWRLDDELTGEDRECPDKIRCNYTSSWTINGRDGSIRGMTVMRSSQIKDKISRANTPDGMVPGGDA